MNSTESFYSSLIELEHILDDLMTLNYEFQESSYSILTDSSTNSHIRNDRLKDVVFDLIVLKLYQLFEIHSIVGNHLIKQNKRDLLQLLKPQWKTIVDEKELVIKWRDELVAHSGNRAKDFQLYNEVDPKYHDTIRKILITSRRAVIYIWSLHANLFNEYKEAWKIKDQKMLGLQRYNITDLLTELINSEKQYFEETNRILQNNNFVCGIFCGYDDYPMTNVSNKIKP